MHATFELYYRICSIASYRLPPHFLFNSCIFVCAVLVYILFIFDSACWQIEKSCTIAPALAGISVQDCNWGCFYAFLIFFVMSMALWHTRIVHIFQFSTTIAAAATKQSKVVSRCLLFFCVKCHIVIEFSHIMKC